MLGSVSFSPGPHIYKPSSTEHLLRVSFIRKWNYAFTQEVCLARLVANNTHDAFTHLLLRAGPVTARQRDFSCLRINPYPKRSNTGFGIALSLSLPGFLRRQLSIKILLTCISVLGKIKVATFWEIDPLRIVSQDATLFHFARLGSLDGVRDLISCGEASARDSTIHGMTPLHVASSRGHIDLAKFLIEIGADINAPDEDGETPLHRALSQKGNYAMARLLIENNADLADRAVGGNSPLHALFNDTIGKVIIRGDWAEEMLPDSDGKSVAHYLSWSSRTPLAIFERGCVFDMLEFWSPDGSGRTCLHCAASRGNMDVLRYLLEQAPTHELQRIDCFGCTILHHSARTSRMIAVIQLLLAKGLSFYAKDSSLQNTLHHAAQHRSLEDIKSLVALDSGNLLLIPDRYGRMPSYFAPGTPSRNVVEYLVSIESTLDGARRCQLAKKDLKNKPRNLTDPVGTLARMAIWQMLEALLKTFDTLSLFASFFLSMVLLAVILVVIMINSNNYQ